MNYTKEEQSFVSRFESAKANSENKVMLTKFLTDREQQMIESIFHGSYASRIHFFGGFPGAEAKRCLISPFDYQETDFKIKLIEITYPYKFLEANHRMVLGNLLNQGIQREAFGDILFFEHKIYIAITEEMEKFFLTSFDTLNHSPIETKIISSLPFEKKIEYEIKKFFVSSMRLDCVLSTMFPFSRSETKELIEKGYVQVNHSVMQNPVCHLKKDDLLSVRGKGRIKIMEEPKIARSGRYILECGFMVS